MDVQRGIVERFTSVGDYLPRMRGAIEAARSADIPVLYVTIGFRAGYPEVSANNELFSAIAGSGTFTPDDAGAEIHPDIAPEKTDIVIPKRRVSAFAGSDLDMVLRARNIDNLVLSGIATSGVVLSTLRQGADLDYRITVLSDGCLDPDEEVHRVLTEKVFPRQGNVITTAAWRDTLGRL